MDTKTLELLHQLAPDLMDRMMLRALVLERIAALAPVGRRALAQRLHMPEREIRSICDALKADGLISAAASGMMPTDRANALLSGVREMTRRKSALSQNEQYIARSLGVGRVCIVQGNAEESEQVLREVGRVTAEHLTHLLADGMVLTVSGGEVVAATADAMNGVRVNVRVLPARGGSNAPAEWQAGTLAVRFAKALEGSYSLIHLPDGLPAEALKELLRLDEVSELTRWLQQTDVLFYEIGRAGDLPKRLFFSQAELGYLVNSGASGEAAGCCFDAQGRAVYQCGGIGLSAEQIAQVRCVAAVGVGADRAKAIESVLRHHRHELLVLDESAAKALEKLL